jgi:hypothetical protein
MINVFKGIVLKAQKNEITIRLPKECSRTSFLEGDPLVVAHEKDGIVEIMGGRTVSFSHDDEQLIFVIDQMDDGVKMRSYERYPVSLYADFKLAGGSGSKKCFALVKDISEYGIRIYARESFFKGQKFNFDIYLTRDILSLTAEIVRKVENDGHFEYGLRIIHNGPTVFNHIKNIIKKTRQEHISKFDSE